MMWGGGEKVERGRTACASTDLAFATGNDPNTTVCVFVKGFSRMLLSSVEGGMMESCAFVPTDGGREGGGSF